MNILITRISIFLLISLQVLLYFLADYERSLLPDYLSQALDAANTKNELKGPVAILALILMFALFVGSIAIFFRKAWGRLTFTIPAIGVHLIHPVIGLSIITPWTAVFDSLFMILSGFVIAMIYFSKDEYLKNKPMRSV